MASMTIDVVALIIAVIIFEILILIGLPENLGQVIMIAVEGLYLLVFLGGYQDSLGHRLLRIRVVRSSGERMEFGRSLLSFFVKGGTNLWFSHMCLGDWVQSEAARPL